MIKLRILRPLDNECLSSYLYRSFQTGDSRAKELLDLMKMLDGSGIHMADRDYNLSQPALDRISRVLQVSQQDLRKLTSPSSWLTISNPSQRKSYCPICIFSDIAACRNPAWRRSWDGFEAVTCVYHGTALSELSVPAVGSDRARVAYTTSCFDFSPAHPQILAPSLRTYPDLQTSSGAWACLWRLGAHVQSFIEVSRKRGYVISGEFCNLPWRECECMFKDILALALRGHTRFKEQRCLVSRVLKNYTAYNPYDSTLDMATKLNQGLAAHSLPARMFAMLILGIFASVFSDGALRVFRNVSEKLAYRFPFDKKKLIKGLLESDIADYEIELLHKQKNWPRQGVEIWRSR